MVGNDIIDIEATKRSKDPNGLGWKRPGFIEKIFTESEQKLIATSKDPFITVWQLWSMKESAYKVFIQAGGEPFYNPKTIECQFESLNGHIKIKKLNLKSKSIVNQAYIFTVVGNENLNIKSKVINIGNDVKLQSKILRKHLLKDLSQTYNLEIAKLKIEKILNGIPRLYYVEKELELAISLTHCGSFGGYSFERLR
ncbi:4'-phosphopantetheinyl transferase superfamily protein [Brumimicrobium mesophilum]|uniref:4'-phosphopantetheinyl transferase superfamily protein n=1 Tax=Brumimicrobium mesophilum TaxID=392717 RepID=UPI000D13F14A|nr:4'-phosphopantetheinyl transferase superfamily protein [Brumimicrobium mesophilum]